MAQETGFVNSLLTSVYQGDEYEYFIWLVLLISRFQKVLKTERLEQI